MEPSLLDLSTFVKQPRTFLKHWSALIRIGTALLGLGAVDVVVRKHAGVPEWVFFTLCISGSAFFVLVLAAVIDWIANRFATLVKMAVFPAPRYCLKVAEQEDLETIFLRFKQEFGDEAPTIHSMTQMFKHNPQIFWKFVDLRAGGEILGTLKVIPLKKHAVRELNAGKLNGRMLQTKDISKPGGKPAGVYVGGLNRSFPDTRKADVPGSAFPLWICAQENPSLRAPAESAWTALC